MTESSRDGRRGSDAPPTLAEVAHRAGVSTATVSRVAAGAAGVRPATRAHVEEAIAATGWVASPTARALAGGRGDEVALVIVVSDAEEATEDPHYARVVAGASDQATRSGCALSVHFTSERSLLGLAPFCGDRRYLGAILVNVDAEVASALLRHGHIPVVSLGLSAPEIPSLDPENFMGAAGAVEHLIANGRRRIVTITGPQRNPCARERWKGYRSAMDAAGYESLGVLGDFTRKGGAAATRLLLDLNPDLDAIFVASDLMATAALQVLAYSGRHVPDDIAVIGFDDSLPARMTSPLLTTVRQPVEQLAATALQTLLEREADRPSRQRLPVRLVVRSSTPA